MGGSSKNVRSFPTATVFKNATRTTNATMNNCQKMAMNLTIHSHMMREFKTMDKEADTKFALDGMVLLPGTVDLHGIVGSIINHREVTINDSSIGYSWGVRVGPEKASCD